MKQDKNQKTVEAYDKNPQFYADTFDSYGVRYNDIDRALKLNQSGSNKIMELGCANGRDAEYIISRVGAENYEGIDASKQLIWLARQKVPHGTFHVKDIREINVVNDELGVIFAFYSLLHMERDDLIQILDICHNSLKIGGILYISSKYGDHKEIEITNLGEKKYYYSYKPEDIEKLFGAEFKTDYKIIHDGEYGPSFTIALRKIG